MNPGLYKEIVLPALVNEVQAIFRECIDPSAGTSKIPLRSFLIDADNQLHAPMLEIMSKYPFLDRHMLVFKLPAGIATGIHLDGLGNKQERIYSLNIPVAGCTENGTTEFFDVDPNHIFFDARTMTRFLINGKPSTKIDEYALVQNPFICYTQHPHRVNNQSDQLRVSVSWTIKKDWLPEQVAELVATGVYDIV